jgi:hypothetical protein
MSQIFRIGSGGRRQCSMRHDGVWFERFKRANGPGWTGWVMTAGGKRPEHAWYDPTAGKARLPE